MATDQRGGQTIAFLDRHRLSHTPGHYAFAYRYLFGSDGPFRTKVAAIIDGGVRITPSQVVELAPETAIPEPANDILMPGLDRITAQVLDIIGAET